MIFNCYYRSKDGSRKELKVNADNRKHAYQQVKDAGLNVIELCPIGNSFKNKQVQETSDTNLVKIPNEEEIKFLLMRKNAFWIGFWSSFFSPILWIIACIICICKYEMRGLSCCITGIIAPSVPIVLGFLGFGSGIGLAECIGIVAQGVAGVFIRIILGIIFFVVGVWISKYFYKKDVLLGFIMPSASVASRM